MRHQSFLIISFVSILLTACQNKPKLMEALTETPDSITTEPLCPTDSTLYGECLESTSLDTLRLVIDNGDTLSFCINGRDSLLFGGLNSGDKLAVLSAKDSLGRLSLSRSINLTTLQGEWLDTAQDSTQARDVRICEGGIITNSPNTFLPKNEKYTDWIIYNGKLILENLTDEKNILSDTFYFKILNADTLQLASPAKSITLKRR